MTPPKVADPREIWNPRFARVRQQVARTGKQLSGTYETWLGRWLSLIARARTAPVLDLGCGSGSDSRYLSEHGFDVLAADISREALAITQSAVAPTRLLEMDIRHGLPFRTGSLPVIVANLSLHYHRWADTCAIFRDVHRCLQPHGVLLARLNSTHDLQHGAHGHPRIERNCYVVGAGMKRFFDRQDLEALFGAPNTDWHIHSMEERIAHCYDNPKSLWEIVAEKPSAAEVK